MSRPELTQERLTALFILGAVLFMPPFLGIFNSPVRVLGIPTLYLYLFTAWTLLIGAVALIMGWAEEEPGGEAGTSPADGPPDSQGE